MIVKIWSQSRRKFVNKHRLLPVSGNQVLWNFLFGKEQGIQNLDDTLQEDCLSVKSSLSERFVA